jgi:tetratricopeptide (TPR) repeat protein
MTQELNNMPESTEIMFLWDLFDAEKFDETIKEAEKYIDDNIDADLNSANKLIGLANFKLGKYEESEQAFTNLANKTNSLEDWFNVLTSATLNKKIELSETAFNKIIDIFTVNNDNNDMSLPQAYFYYIQALSDVSEFKTGFIRLSQLAQYYIQYKITDSHFLYLRGVPFLPDTIIASKKIFENSDKVEAGNLLDKLESELDEEGKVFISHFRTTLKY